MGNAIHVNSNVVNSNYPAILRGGLNVSGAETILSSATVSDLTSTRVVYAGTSGSLEDSANLTFTSNTLYALNIDVDGLAELDDINVSAASTFAGAIDANGDLDVDGHTELDNLNVAGISTFNDDVNFVTQNTNNIIVDKSDNSMRLGDNVALKIGDNSGNGDLWLYHDTSNSYIRRYGSGNLRLTTSSGKIQFQKHGADTLAEFNVDSSVDLYYDATKRFATSGVGVTVYNQLDVTNINASGIITAVDGNFTGNVSIAGTLTYQDVTNVDSFGIGTFRTGVHVLSNGIDAVGVITATQGLDAIGIQSGGVNITTGIITAINFTGTGNTVTYNSSTKVVSVSVGGAGGSGTGGKFVENNTGIHTLSNVGIGTTNASDKLKVLGDVAFTGALKVSPLGLSGSNGNYLKSVGSGVTWASFPTARTVGLQTATNNQTSFSFAYNVGFLDVYINGVKLTANEFTATNGTSVVLTDGAFTGDQVQFISFNTTASGGGGGSGISEVVQDTTPQLGGNLDLNSKIINGSGYIDYTGNFKASGIATATTFVGALTGNASSATILQTARTIGGVSFNGSANINLPGVNAAGNQDTSGNATTATTAVTATNVTVSANNSTNETVYPIFVDGATGSQGAETDTGLNYNPSTGRLTAVSYAGDGSALTGISGSGGVTVQDEGSALSTTGTTLNFVGSGVVASGNGATKTITIAGGGGSGNAGFSTAGGNFTVNAGVTTVINTFNINTNTKLSEYTIHLENVNGNIQSQKVLVMNYGAGIGLTAYSSEYGIMFHPNQIADIGVVVTAGICSLTATTKSGITGITTFSLTRQDQS